MNEPIRLVRCTCTGLAALLALAVANASALAANREAGKRPDPLSLARLIDQQVDTTLAAEKLKPAPLADDAEFLRRAYLDITGVIPPADRAAAFLDSKDPDKRAKLIDELLASPRFGKHMADIWQALLVQHDPDNRRLRFDPLVTWLEEAFNADKPWNQVVMELLTATGEQDKNGAVTFFLANPTPDKVTDRVSRAFLGVRLQCAQCHNHPFTKWKQTDYWGMAAFFTRVRFNGNVQQMLRQGESPGINESSRGRPVKLPDSAKMVPPRFFLGEEPRVSRDEPYRPVLARWLTATDNPYFARAMVNRVWAQFFARGLVNPVDDIQEANAPSHPELFDQLAREFSGKGYDVKFLMRAICNSQAYQRTSKAGGSDADAEVRLFGRMAIKPLAPEQLFDSLEQVLGRAERTGGPRAGGGQRGPVSPREQFVNFFQVDETAEATEYQGGIPQALRLMNAPQMNNGGSTLREALRSGSQDSAAILDHLFLATLSRRPTPQEMDRLTAYINGHEDSRKAYSDILWALVNSSEFTLNH